MMMESMDFHLVHVTAVLVRTVARRLPAGIPIQSGLARSEATDGGGSRELGVCDVPVLNTQAVQTH